jgi:hypothetical protein
VFHRYFLGFGWLKDDVLLRFELRVRSLTVAAPKVETRIFE